MRSIVLDDDDQGEQQQRRRWQQQQRGVWRVCCVYLINPLEARMQGVDDAPGFVSIKRLRPG
jgi:hypothetical protein